MLSQPLNDLQAYTHIKVYNGRAEIENRIKEGKITLRWDKTSCTRFEANEARLKMGVLAYNLLHMFGKLCIRAEGLRRSIEWLILRLIKVGARVSYHARKWHVHISTAFPLAHHYQEAFDSGCGFKGQDVTEAFVDFLVQKGIASSNTEKEVFSSCIGKHAVDILSYLESIHGCFQVSNFKITPFGPEKLVLTHNFENWIPKLSGFSGVSIETVEGIIQD